MAIEIVVAGENRSDKRLAAAPLSWSDQVNGRGSLQITFADEVGGWRPEDGQEILIVEDDPAIILTSDDAQVLAADLDDTEIITGAARLFGGVLMEPEEWEEPGTGMLFFGCSASEFSALCDRRIVARLYEQASLDSIVRDIVDKDLSGDVISTSGVETGPTIEKALFADVTVTEAFNDLAELTGYTWRIDAYRVLHFRARASLTAPIPLDGDTLLAGSVRVRRDREKYRNVQLVKAGTDLTEPRTETLVGDGARKVFATAFPLGTVPTIEESRGGGAWASKTVGILGVEREKAWYWNSGQAQVSQDDAGEVLVAPTDPSDPTTGDRVRVTYRGLFPVKTQYRDLAEIASRQAIEGGSGIYTSVEDRPQINSAQSALDTATALIDRYGRIGTIVEGRTRAAHFEPGQVATVNLPRHGIVGQEMLIESVSAEHVDVQAPGRDHGEVWYNLRAISGDPFGGWQEYFRKLLGANRSLVIGREGEILVLLRAAAAAVECGVSIESVETVAPESRIGIMAIGTGEIGATT